MTLLEKIHRGRAPRPPRILAYGVEGIGKSTFASEAPRPVFIQTEDGGFNRGRTIASAIGKGGGDRILRCVGGPS